MKKITVVSVPVSDQQVSKEFYLKLGFHIIIEAPMGNNQMWLQMGFEGTEASITLVTWFEKMKPGSMHGLIVLVDNIDVEMEGLVAKGVKIGKLDVTPWGKFLSIEDPDGNSISLHQE